MRITFKREYGRYIVTVNGTAYTFDTHKDAWTFIDATRKEVA